MIIGVMIIGATIIGATTIIGEGIGRLYPVVVQHRFDGAMAIFAKAPDQRHGGQTAAGHQAQGGEDGNEA